MSKVLHHFLVKLSFSLKYLPVCSHIVLNFSDANVCLKWKVILNKVHVYIFFEVSLIWIATNLSNVCCLINVIFWGTIWHLMKLVQCTEVLQLVKKINKENKYKLHRLNKIINGKLKFPVIKCLGFTIFFPDKKKVWNAQTLHWDQFHNF